MGRLVEALAPAHGCEAAGIVTRANGQGWEDAVRIAADVAIDFSHGDAVRANLEHLAGRGLDVVIGTTGWQNDEAACREIAEKAGIGVLASANFAVGMQIFRAVVED